MKKIKILHGFIILLEIILLFRFAYLIINIPLKHFTNVIPNLPFILLIGLFFIERGLFYSIKKGYFNVESNLKFKRGGFFFILSGLINLLIGTITLMVQFNTTLEKVHLYENISRSFLIFIIGLGFIIISDFIKKGNQIKQENDLTI